MATVGETTRPGYVYDSATDVWIPVGIGPHSHTPAAIGAISSSVVTTKGDLIVATGSGTVVRQGVGADGSYLVADSTQADGVTWAGPSTMAGRNAVLNSNFSVWQRGTSIVPTTTSYTADRWQAYRGTTGSTVSRQLTSDSTNLPNIQYCARVSRDSGNTSTQDIYLTQPFESVNSIPFAGKTITLSFYARRGANFSASGINVTLYTGTGTDQNILTGYTGNVTLISQAQGLTTTWTRYSYTATVASNATEIQPLIGFVPVGTAGANDYFEITGVQLEVGSVATPYAPNGATYQAELAACQRYYIRENYTVATGSQHNGVAVSTTLHDTCITLPVQMRVTPTSLDIANVQIFNYITSGGYTTGTYALTSFSSPQTAVLRYTHGSAVFTAATNYGLAGTATAGYVGFSAEL